MDTDASGSSLGAVLSQVQGGSERVIAYASRLCSTAERNYNVTRREMLAIVYFLKVFRQYLLGRPFDIRTDHAALQWIKRNPTPIGQQARWVEQLEEYDYTVLHRAGSRHGNADALSRRPTGESGDSLCAISTVIHALVLDKNETDMELADDRQTITSSEAGQTQRDVAMEENKPMKDRQMEDPILKELFTLKQSGQEQPDLNKYNNKSPTLKSLLQQWSEIHIHQDRLCRKFHKTGDEDFIWQVLLPASMKDEVLEAIHAGLDGGHLGLKTLRKVQRRTYWVGWSNDVKDFVRKCTSCASFHRGKPPKQGYLANFTVGAPMERLGIDLTGPHPVSRKGNKYIVTVIDYFTRWTEAYPARNQEAGTVAKVLVEKIFVKFGVPLQIITDQGANFESQLFHSMCDLLKIEKIRTTAYEPQTNGLIERFHRTMNSIRAKTIAENQENWDERLPFVMAAYRATEHEATGFTPN